MEIAVKIILITIIYIVAFISMGLLFTKKYKCNSNSLSFNLILGFLLYFSLFQIVSLPFTIFHAPLHTISILWMLILAIFIIVSAIICSNQWYSCIQNIKYWFAKMSVLKIVVICVIVIQVLLATLNSYNDLDDATYTASIGTNVQTDTIWRYMPETGREYYFFPYRYALSSYITSCSVTSQVFNINPLILTKTILPIIFMSMLNVVYYKIAQVIWDKKDNASMLFILVCGIANYFGAFSGYSSTTFLFLRTYQGKAVIAFMAITILFYCFLCLFKDYKNKLYWFMLILISLFSVSISLSSLAPIAISVLSFFIVMLIVKKDLTILKNAVAVIAPIAVFGIIILLYKYEILNPYY